MARYKSRSKSKKKPVVAPLPAPVLPKARLQLCEKGHHSITFYGLDCPLCAADDKVATLESKVEELEGELEGARDDISYYRNKYEW